MQGLTPHAVAMNFGPGMLDESACRAWVVLATRGENPCCPSCGAVFDERQRARVLNGKNVECRCGVKSSPRSGTVLEGSTLTDAQLLLMLALMHLEIPAYQIANMVGCAPATVYNWQHRVMSDD